jgi:hypothetical protein
MPPFGPDKLVLKGLPAATMVKSMLQEIAVPKRSLCISQLLAKLVPVLVVEFQYANVARRNTYFS